jgi:hypothetical protein
MQRQSWSISSKDYIVENDNDDDEVQSGNKFNEEPEEEEVEEQTLKPANTFKSARQSMIERKLHDTDARGQLFK